MSQIYMKHQDELEASYIMLCIIDFSMRQIKKENIYNMIYFKFLVSFTTNFVWISYTLFRRRISYTFVVELKKLVENSTNSF